MFLLCFQTKYHQCDCEVALLCECHICLKTIKCETLSDIRKSDRMHNTICSSGIFSGIFPLSYNHNLHLSQCGNSTDNVLSSYLPACSGFRCVCVCATFQHFPRQIPLFTWPTTCFSHFATERTSASASFRSAARDMVVLQCSTSHLTVCRRLNCQSKCWLLLCVLLNKYLCPV